MTDVIAVYRASAKEIADLWNRHCGQLGVSPLRPLKPEASGWDIARLHDSEMYVALPARPFWPFAEGEVGLEVAFRNRDWPKLDHFFEQLQKLPLQPFIVMMVDHSWDFVEENLVSYWLDCSPAKVLDAIESNLYRFEVHAIQAIHRDLLHPLDEWLSCCKERGYPLRTQGAYAILDVHWSRAGQGALSTANQQTPDPVTGLLGESYLRDQLERHLATPAGTIILVTIDSVEPNPNREHQRWLEALSLVAQALKSTLTEGDTLAHYHTQRHFAIVKPGLVCAEVSKELDRLRTLLTQLNGLKVKGQFTTASWPEDGQTFEDMWGGSGWDKLNGDYEGTVTF